jgi:hypothetical protein
MGGKPRLKHVERLTVINCETMHLVGCTLRTVSLYHKLTATKIWNESISQPDFKNGCRSLFMTFAPYSRPPSDFVMHITPVDVRLSVTRSTRNVASFSLGRVQINRAMELVYLARCPTMSSSTVVHYARQLDIHHDVSCERNGFLFFTTEGQCHLQGSWQFGSFLMPSYQRPNISDFSPH